jgi:hypothetical protein
VIAQKNNLILYLEETIDSLKRELRVMEDEYLCAQNNSSSEKEYFEK